VKPFRKNVALAIDGGGIRGVMVTRALSILEDELKQPLHEICRLAAGTSTGSIIAAGIGIKKTAADLTGIYKTIGPDIFKRTWRKSLFPLSRYRYPEEPLKKALETYFGGLKMGEFWNMERAFDLVITTFDLQTNRTCFVKPWKTEYADWPVVRAVQGSCTVPTYFPIVEGRWIDGGVGSYANPCYLAAYEAQFCLNWDPMETTLISLGTGREPHHYEPDQARELWAWDWINPMIGAFLQSTYDQQVNLVDTFFKSLDFRRFQIDLSHSIEMDDASQIPALLKYGDELGKMILEDDVDPIQHLRPQKAPKM